MPNASITSITTGDTSSATWANAVRSSIQSLETNATNYATTAGTQPTYTISLPASYAPTAYTEGMIVYAKIHSSNSSGASTINVNSLGAKNVLRLDGQALLPYDLLSGSIVVLLYDGTQFLLIAQRPYSVVSTTSVGNVGTGEDDLISTTIPASLLAKTNDVLEVEALFTFAANANAKTVKLYFGSTAIYSSGAQNQNGGSLLVRARIVRTGAATQITFANAVGSASSLYGTECQTAAPTETLSSTVVVKATGEATSDNDIQETFVSLKLVSATA